MSEQRRPGVGPGAGLIGIWTITLVAVPLFTWGLIDSMQGSDKLGTGWLIALAAIVLLILGNAVAQTVIRVRELRDKRG